MVVSEEQKHYACRMRCCCYNCHGGGEVGWGARRVMACYFFFVSCVLAWHVPGFMYSCAEAVGTKAQQDES